MRSTQRIRGTMVLAALAAMPVIAAAQTTFTATGLLPVTLEIAASCTVNAADLDFGRYVATAAAAQRGQTTIQLQCTSGTTVDIGLSAGQAPGATTLDRRLVAGADMLRYGLYQDAARRLNWGDAPGVDTVELVSAGTTQSVAVYGAIPAGQQVPAGSYGDVITIHLYY